MDEALRNIEAMVPALLFLCTGVPLATLLDRLGFFDSVAMAIERRWHHVPVLVLWALAGVTTATLNLDTTIVLLTPLYVRLARRAGIDPLPLALVPLLLASFASSVLPVSNLTTLIAVERHELGVVDVVGRLGPASLVACAVGWLVYRRRYPTVIVADPHARPDPRALTIGGVVVTLLLVGFVLGPTWGVDAWMVALGADLVLVVVTRHLPWREAPVLTALGVAVVGGLVAVSSAADALARLFDATHPVALGGLALAAAGAANLVNNLPALLVGIEATESMGAASWAWLAGVNTGAVLLPVGALANILWWRIVREEGIDLGAGAYVRTVVPLALPALVAAAVTVGLTSTLW